MRHGMLQHEHDSIDAPKTLQDFVRHQYAFAARKHDLHHPDSNPIAYADMQINEMTNSEFLAAMSDAFEQLIGARKCA